VAPFFSGWIQSTCTDDWPDTRVRGKNVATFDTQGRKLVMYNFQQIIHFLRRNAGLRVKVFIMIQVSASNHSGAFPRQ
jgi:hypothetical protein